MDFHRSFSATLPTILLFHLFIASVFKPRYHFTVKHFHGLTAEVAVMPSAPVLKTYRF
jgi:hypothetical protein